jgi:hypothetical protein
VTIASVHASRIDKITHSVERFRGNAAGGVLCDHLAGGWRLAARLEAEMPPQGNRNTGAGDSPKLGILADVCFRGVV